MHRSKITKQKTLGSYPYLSVLFSITLALFVMGIFGVLLIYSSGLEKVIRSQIRIHVYLNNHISETQQTQIRQTLTTRYFTNQSTPDEAVLFVSKEEAARIFIKETGEDFTQFLGENPLHDAFLVQIKPRYHHAEAMDAIKHEIEEIRGVFQAHYLKNVIHSIHKNITRIGIILLGLIGALLIVVIFLINHSIRLALFSQRFLIRSMQLVGARQGFIQRAFLLRATAHGFISGVLACIFLATLLEIAQRRLPDLILIRNDNQLMMLAGGLLITGSLISLFSTWHSVRKYIRMSLDELY